MTAGAAGDPSGAPEGPRGAAALLHDDALPWVSSLRALQQAAAVIAKTTRLDELFDAVADQVMLVVPYHSLRLFLLDDSGEHLVPAAIRSVVDDAELADLDDPRFRLKVGQGVTGYIAESGRSEIVYDLETHPRAFHIPDTPRVEESMVGVPLIHGGTTVGVLTLSKHGLAQFTPEQTALLEVLAVTISSNIQHRRAMQAEQRATTEQARLRELHSTFIANVSHELRTPLTTIQGFLELGTRQADEALKPLLEGAQRGSKRLSQLIGDLLEIVSVEAGRQRIAPEPHHLGALLQLAYARAEQAEGRVHLEDFDVTTVVVVDANRVANVLAELLTNAVKYGPDGAPIALRYRGDDLFHVIDVVDEGPGIPEDEHDEIFQRFTQRDPTSTRQQGGTGIGLALARAVARWHGGDLVIVPDAPTTTFRLTLPRSPAPRDEV